MKPSCINRFKKCDLTFELEKIREGRRIARLKFIIIEQEYHEAAPVILPDADKEREAKPPESVRDRLIYYGISAKQADGFIRSIGETGWRPREGEGAGS